MTNRNNTRPAKRNRSREAQPCSRPILGILLLASILLVQSSADNSPDYYEESAALDLQRHQNSSSPSLRGGSGSTTEPVDQLSQPRTLSDADDYDWYNAKYTKRSNKDTAGLNPNQQNGKKDGTRLRDKLNLRDKKPKGLDLVGIDEIMIQTQQDLEDTEDLLEDISEEQAELYGAASADEQYDTEEYEQDEKDYELVQKSTNDESELSAYIIGGTPSSPNRYKYMASLTTDGEHQCGGSLIAPDIILTAGHCTLTSQAKLIGETIVIGRHVLDDRREAETEEYETHVMDKQVIHPQYYEPQPGKIHYDFKLLKIHGQSKFPLVKLNFDDSLPGSHGSEMTLMGWGSTGNDYIGGSEKHMMREVKVNFVSRAMCEAAYDESVFEEANPLSTTQVGPESLCHYTRGKDSCAGDSGGPVILNRGSDSEDVQVALTSWGFGCAEPGIPAVNMRISAQSAWIKSAVCSLSQAGDGIPEYFECDKKDDYLLRGQSEERGEEEGNTNKTKRPVSITIQIELDNIPSRTGWILQTAREGKLVASAPIGSYKNRDRHQVVREVATINDVDDYEIIILDSSGVGRVSYAVYSRSGELLSGGGVDGSPFGRSIEHTFTLKPDAHKTIHLPWVAGIEYQPTAIGLGDEVVFESGRSRSDDIIQFKSQQHYLKCNYDDAVRVPEVDGKRVFQAKRIGKAYFGCSKHCINGHKIEVRVRKGVVKGFNKFTGRPCDSNSGRGAKRMRASNISRCQRHCRKNKVCNGFEYIKGRRGTCTLYKGQPKPSPIARVKPELLEEYKKYTCGAVS